MKILVIRFSSIGDIVLTTPVIRCIKKQVTASSSKLPGRGEKELPENIELHYLTKKQFASILENNPYIDKLHTIKNNTSEIIEELKKENFDFIVDLHYNLRTFTVKRQLNKPSASFNKLNIEKWLMVYFKINKLPNIHIVDRYMETVKKLGVVNDEAGLDYFIPAQDEVDIATLPSSHQNGYIGFVIGAAHKTKQLPTEKIISICKKINQPIVLLGGKEDAEKAKEIETAVGPIIYNACGKYNLNQSASLIKQADQIITHDTGLMHIASAFNKKIISVWGNTIPEFGMYPYYATSEKQIANSLGGQKENKNTIVDVRNLSCRPCSKIGFDKCPKGHFKCMKEINETTIIKAITER